MAIGDLTRNYYNSFRYDENAVMQTLEITNELGTVLQNRFQLREVPDQQERVTITGKTEININEEIANANQFKVDYNGGWCYFHASLEGQSITVARYHGKGRILYNVDRIAQFDSNGNIIQTLEELIATGKGDTGAPGKTWLSDTGVPSSGIGTYGDFFVSETTPFKWYEKVDPTGWVERGQLLGATGATGASGEIVDFATVNHSANTFTLDCTNQLNFKITNADSAAKTITITNVPSTAGKLIVIGIELVITTVADFTYTNVVWEDGVKPQLQAGKSYEIYLITRNGGTTPLKGSWGGEYA